MKGVASFLLYSASIVSSIYLVMMLGWGLYPDNWLWVIGGTLLSACFSGVAASLD